MRLHFSSILLFAAAVADAAAVGVCRWKVAFTLFRVTTAIVLWYFSLFEQLKCVKSTTKRKKKETENLALVKKENKNRLREMRSNRYLWREVTKKFVVSRSLFGWCGKSFHQEWLFDVCDSNQTFCFAFQTQQTFFSISLMAMLWFFLLLVTIYPPPALQTPENNERKCFTNNN